MKILTLFSASLFVFGLAACGDDEPASTAPAETGDMMASEEMMPMDEGMEDAGMHGMDQMGGIGRASGVIRSVDSEAGFVTINHGPFEGDIQMGAMTRGFDTMGDADLSALAAGDEVSFMVKQGRDGSYRVMAICNTGTEGADCLDGMMDHGE